MIIQNLTVLNEFALVPKRYAFLLKEHSYHAAAQISLARHLAHVITVVLGPSQLASRVTRLDLAWLSIPLHPRHPTPFAEDSFPN
jgi:hypothetical protein